MGYIYEKHALMWSVTVQVIFFSFRIEFSVGDGEIKNFTMVERHFFHDLCLKSFHITFPSVFQIQPTHVNTYMNYQI